MGQLGCSESAVVHDGAQLSGLATFPSGPTPTIPVSIEGFVIVASLMLLSFVVLKDQLQLGDLFVCVCIAGPQTSNFSLQEIGACRNLNHSYQLPLAFP